MAGTGRMPHRLAGMVVFSCGVFCMAVMDAGAKWLTGSFPVVQLIFFDSLFGAAAISLKIAAEGHGVLRSRRWPWMMARGLLTACTMFLFFSALKYIPLAQTTIIFLMAPLLTVLLSMVLLGEWVHAVYVIAAGLSLAGAALVVQPVGLRFHIAMLLPLGAALTTALGLVASKILVRTESPSAIVVYEVIVLMGLSSVLMADKWVTPAPADWPIIMVTGIMGTMAVFLRTKACSFSPLSRLAVLEYSGILWAILFGFLIWRELPDLASLVGAAMIAAGGFWAVRRHLAEPDAASPP